MSITMLREVEIVQLLTFLGTGKYQTTRYTWQEREIETPYVAKALCEFFQPDRVTVFVTSEAKDMHWESLKKELCSNLTLTEASIPFGQSEEDIWKIGETSR